MEVVDNSIYQGDLLLAGLKIIFERSKTEQIAVLFHLVPQIPLIEANDGVSRQFFGLKVTQSGLKCISIGYNILFYIWEL